MCFGRRPYYVFIIHDDRSRGGTVFTAVSFPDDISKSIRLPSQLQSITARY